jgi:hypothetical protein
MGGSALAIRPKNQINFLNPASYTAQDTLSFLFQGGLTGRFSKLSADEGSQDVGNVNLEYLTMGFPIARWWKFSVGLVPYSRMKYEYKDYPSLGQNELIEVSSDGDGGFNEFYFGSAWQPLKDLSVGVNAGYVFGKLHKSRRVDLMNVGGASSTSIIEDYTAHDFYFRFGLQYHPTFTDNSDRKHTVVVGLTYDTKVDIEVDFNGQANRAFIRPISGYEPLELIDTFSHGDSLAYLKLPDKIGFGISYNLNDKIIATAEYSRQNFSKGIGINKYQRMADYSSFRFGLEYNPAPLSDRQRASYIQRMHYRIGGHYTNTYLQFDGSQVRDYGVSAGLGFPWRNSQKLYSYTTFNISYEYGVRGTMDNIYLKENYHIITLGFILHDFWFNKSKYD